MQGNLLWRFSAFILLAYLLLLMLFIPGFITKSMGMEGWRDRLHLAPKHAQYQYSLTPAQEAWISSAKNKHGDLCCSKADGYRPDEEDIDWDNEAGNYRVRVDGQWQVVDDMRLVDPILYPNIIGRAVAWWGTSYDSESATTTKFIRCLAPGSGG